MALPELGYTASLITLYSLHILLPKIYLQDRDINGNFFSFAFDPCQKIGPEFREFLIESVQYTVRSNLTIRSFSMLKSVFKGYLESTSRNIDSLLESVVYGEEDQENSLLEIVEVGNSFCSLRQPHALFFPSTGSSKWIDFSPLFFIDNISSSQICLYGVVGDNSKQMSKRKRALQSFYELDFRKPILKNRPVFSEGVSDILSYMTHLKSSFTLLPTGNQDLLCDRRLPLSYIRPIHTRWKGIALPENRGECLGFGSIDRMKLTSAPAALIPKPFLEEATVLSTFYPSLTISQFQILVEDVLKFSCNSADQRHVKCICELSLRNEKRNEISIEEGLIRISEEKGWQYRRVKNPALQHEEMLITFSFHMLEEMEIPVPRIAILALFGKKEGQRQIVDSCCIPFFSYEVELSLLKKSNCSSLFIEK